MLGGMMGALGAGGGAGAGVLGAGAGLAMATMGGDKEKKELRQKQNDQRDSEFGLLMVMQNRHRALTKVEGEVGRRAFLILDEGFGRKYGLHEQ